MQDVLTFGKRLVPLEQIALVEPFVARRNAEFKPEKEFKARVVLINRDIVLGETAPRDLAEAHGLRYLDEDDIAVNSGIAFRVETFEATDSFSPEKPYKTRIKWDDREGKEQSKLLLTSPEAVIGIVLRGGAEPPSVNAARSSRPPAKRSRRKVPKAEAMHP